MEVIETSDFIKIQFSPDGIPYESIYNREYFLLLGINMVESEEEKKVGGLRKFLKEKEKTKSIPDFVIDSADSTINVVTKGLKNSAEKIIEKGEASFTEMFSSNEKTELVIKKDKKYTLKTLDNEIQEVYDRAKTIFNFDSGFTYDEYSNIVKDLYIQLAYLNFLNVKIEQIFFKRVFKINGRYVLLENNVKEMEGESNHFKELERKMVELTGKKYEKGQFERDIGMIEGTEIYKYKDLYFEKV